MSRKSNDPWVRIFNVSDPVLHKKGYTLYKVTSKVFPRNIIEAETQVTVWKRYNDFKKLHKSLYTIHQGLYIRDPFPPFAKARFFGRFDEHVIEERRKSALQLLEFAAKHPPLFTSQVFVKFFEEGKHPDMGLKDDKTKPNEIMQPLEANKSSQTFVPSFSNREDRRAQNENPESKDLLGGIWNHHQVADEISLSSQATEGDDEEDDRTTFTDDDHCSSVPPLDVSEFDPLRESCSLTKSRFVTDSRPEDFCNDWLLSALQSCAPPESDGMDLECNMSNTLEFPKPFGDIDDSDMPSPNATSEITSPKKENSRDSCLTLKQNVITENCSVYDCSEFDPLISSSTPNDGTLSDIESVSEFRRYSTTSSSETVVLDHEAYMVEAARFIMEAHESEALANYISAFNCYKSAINILLQGVQKDPCTERKEAVRRKILQYLLRAEEIYENHLPLSNSKRYKDELGTFPPALETKPLSLRGSIEELAKFKVLGVLNKVLLVLDVTSSKTYVVKTLHKSSSPKPNIPNTVPQNIPFMVQLYQVFETCHTLFLILQFASGGRVWDYIGSYLQRSPVTPNKEVSILFSDPQDVTDLSNVYSGKKLALSASERNLPNGEQSILKAVASEASLVSVDSDLTPAAECPPSYVALFKNCPSSDDDDDNGVSVSKCHIVPQVLEYNIMDQNDSTRNKNVAAGFDFATQSNDLNLSNCDGDEFENLNKLDRGNNQAYMSNGSTCGHSNMENQVSKSAIDDKILNCIPCDANTLNEIILNSKTLIKNVDRTMNFSQNVLLLDEDSAADAAAFQRSDFPSNTDIETKSNDMVDVCDNCDFFAPASSLTKSEKGISKIIGQQQKEIERIHSSVKQPLSTDSRSRLSSSTGSLERAFSHRVCFTEAFRQMDVAISQAATNPVHLPESCVSLWAAEIVVALHSLHSLGIVWQDLHPANLLLGTEGHILLTYKSEWNCVDNVISTSAKENLYAAPEIGNVFPVTSSCDWWSFGALLFELLTGRTLASCHPGGITSHTTLNIPPGISSEASDLLKKLLVYDTSERLGAGPLGVEDIKAHPFFMQTDWESLH